MTVEMKKRDLMVTILMSVMMCITACGSTKPSSSDITARRERTGDTDVTADTEDAGQAAEDIWADAEYAETDRADGIEGAWADAGDGREDLETTGTDVHDEIENIWNGVMQKEDAALESAPAGNAVANGKKGIVFGSSEATGYTDFKYLTEEHISTAKTSSRTREGFSAYIPKEEKPRVSGASARGERAGVYVKVDLEPYLQYKAESYSLRNNLDKYVTGEMDYYENYYDVIVGNVEESGDMAVCEVTYMEYDFYEDTYSPYYVVYSLHDLGDNVMALVTMSIDADNVTEETKELVDELASFYQITIHWDETFAKTKRDKFEDKYTGNIFTVDCLSFKLPDGWEIDEELSYYYETYFAPGGDAEAAGVSFVVWSVSEASGIVDMFLEDMEGWEEAFAEEFDNELDKVAIHDVGFTFLGRTFMMDMTIHSEEGGNGVMYMAEDDNNLYVFYAYSVFEDEEETEGLAEEAQEALTMFLETGRVIDSFT